MEDKKADNSQEILNTIMNAEDVVHEAKNTEVMPPYSNNDLEYARTNIMSVIEKGNDAVGELLEIAKMSGHPRAFEVLSNLISTLVAANRDFLEVKKLNQDIEIRSGNGANKTINNNLILTTAELAKLLTHERETIKDGLQ